MSTPNELKKLEFRVALLERAFTYASGQISELTAALASLPGGSKQAEQVSPEPIAITADSVAPFGAGFYRREEDNTGRPFRWTGRSDHFELRLGINRNVPWSFSIEVRPNPNVPLETLRAFVDYNEIALEIDAGRRVLRGTLPARGFGNQAVLTVFMPNTFRPSDLDPKSKDTRTLGLAFYGLTLAPVISGTGEGIQKAAATNGMDVLPEGETPTATATVDG